MNQTLVQYNQTILDIAIRYTGTWTTAFEIAMQNELCVSDDLAAGQELELPLTPANDIITYYANEGLYPSTAMSEFDFNLFSDLNGLDTMAVGENFIVE